MNAVFVYGTLLNDEILNLFIQSEPIKQRARLDNYQRVQVLGEVYPAIYPKENACVEGLLLSNLSDSDIQALDEYEGEYYERTVVEVTLVDNVLEEKASRLCETFVFKKQYADRLSSQLWSNDYFRQEHLASFLQGWLGFSNA